MNKQTHSPYAQAMKLMKSSSPDEKKGAQLLEKAAALNDPRAYYALGTWYLHGHYYKRDFEKAVNLLKKAAKANIAEAAFDLAVCYEKSAGVSYSPAKAYELYLKAALLGDAQSFYEIGRLHYYGIGTPKDKDMAEIWLAHAEKLGIVE
ncbi:MAG: tetratricopeptide repeat protein [Bacteroidota bacterium]